MTGLLAPDVSGGIRPGSGGSGGSGGSPGGGLIVEDMTGLRAPVVSGDASGGSDNPDDALDGDVRMASPDLDIAGVSRPSGGPDDAPGSPICPGLGKLSCILVPAL
jgi:hypothetical protein